MMHNHVYADTSRPCWEVQNFVPETFSNACYTAALVCLDCIDETTLMLADAIGNMAYHSEFRLQTPDLSAATRQAD